MTHTSEAKTVELPNGQVRTFDYYPRLDPRNNQYLVRDAPRAATPNWERSVWWTGGAVLDQGREGACVGFGCSGEYGASPVRGKISDELGMTIYRRAKEIDEWEGVDYDGTSVRAGMLVGREHGWWPGFRWGKNVAEILQGLQNWGPVVVGVEWREGMYDTDENGLVEVSGDVVGGHCLVITGYSRNYGGKGRRFRWRNSWNLGYGKRGNGYISPDDLDAVCFGSGGEAAVIETRAIGQG